MRCLSILAGVVLLAATAAPAAQSPAGRETPRPSPRISLEVRAAPLGDIAAQLSRAVGTTLSVGPDLADQRITARAAETTLPEFASAARRLLHATQTAESAPRGLIHLDRPTGSDGAARAHLLERRAALLRRLQEISLALLRPNPDRAVEDARQRAATDHPELPAASVDLITLASLRPALLLSPLRGLRQQRLAESGFLGLPLRTLTPAQQQLCQLFVTGALTGSPRAVNESTQELNLRSWELLSSPQSRIEYRLVYGDAWSDIVLVVRVGFPDHWTSATLGGTLAPLEDGRVLEPAREPSPANPALDRRLLTPLSVAGMNADQALGALARAANIKLIADSYARPALYRPKDRTETLNGLTLREALDALAADYGLYWWHQDGWFHFRHRLWPEEDRVAVPDRQLRPLGLAVRQTGKIDHPGLEFLASLDDERILTLELVGRAQGRADAPASTFDLNEMDLIQRGLDYSRSLAPAQRDLATAGSLPMSYLSPAQQSDFAAMAYDYGFLIDPALIDSCSFRVNQSMGAPGRGVVDGMLVVQLGFAGGPPRSATLSLRLPVPDEPAPGTAQPGPAPAP